MTPDLLSQILAHARAEAPRESCGVLTWDGKDRAIYHPCRNMAEDGGEFSIHPEDWVAAEDAGPVLGIVHSHPGGTVALSEADKRGMERSAVPWWVVVPETGEWRRHRPSTWPLAGHPFAWGVQDCYTLAGDAFRGLPEFLRAPRFWEGSDLFREGLASAGFREVDGPPCIGDALLMTIRGGGVPNHCALYLGAGRVVHHLPGRLSREEDLGPLSRAVVAVVREAR